MKSLALLPLLIGVAIAQAAAPNLNTVKKQAVAGVAARAKLAQEINDSLFSFSELGFQEVETSRYLASTAGAERLHDRAGRRGHAERVGRALDQRAGRAGDRARARTSTAFPKASQKPGIPWHEPIIEGAPGHGEGHNSGQAVNIVAALAVQEIMKQREHRGHADALAGRRRGAARRQGLLSCATACSTASTPCSSRTSPTTSRPPGDSRCGTGLVSVEYTFHGESAHSAHGAVAGPQRARCGRAHEHGLGHAPRASAARAALALRHHRRRRSAERRAVARVRLVLSSASRRSSGIRQNFGIGNKIADAAAQMTDTTVTRRMLGSAALPALQPADGRGGDTRTSRPSGCRRGRDDEQTFAKAVQKNDRREGGGSARRRLESARGADAGAAQRRLGRYRRRVVDRADDHRALSGEHPRPAGPHLGQRHRHGHADRAQGRGGGIEGHRDDDARPADEQEAAPGARGTTSTACRPRTRSTCRCSPPNDRPPTELNADTMARYRDELSKYYYDPTRYDTYLEQLGITFPTLEKPAAAK